MKVVVATDGSTHAENAARFLARLPHRELLEITVVAVHQPLPVHGSTEVVAWIERQQEAEQERAKGACQRVADLFAGTHANVEIVCLEGHAGRMILDAADQRSADLIVLGAEGHSVVERILLGSVSDFVATHANCSVLVVRPSGPDDPPASELSVCVAYDGSEPARHAIAELGVFDWPANSRFDAVSVLEIPAMPMDIPMTLDLEPIRSALQDTVQEAAATLRKLCPQVQSDVIEGGHVGHSLVSFADEHKCNLIVVGHTGMGLVGQFLLGGVSRYVVRHAECSVWISRQRRGS